MLNAVTDPRDLLLGDKARQGAEILQSDAERPANFQKIYLDLTNARSNSDVYELRNFRSLYVGRASDSAAELELILHENTVGNTQNAIPVQLRDSLKFPKAISRAFLKNTAQAGKWVEIWISMDGEVANGRQISVTSGGISITEGSNRATRRTAVPNAAATEIIPQNLNRFTATFKNDTGTDLWLGEAGIDNGASKGLLLPPLETYIWKNTNSLYAYQASGAPVTIAVLEET